MICARLPAAACSISSPPLPPASRRPGRDAVRRVARQTMAGGALPVWFAGQMAGLAGTVWCNASAAAALDLDDGHRIARGHPGARHHPRGLCCRAGGGFDDAGSAAGDRRRL